jgi:hypothetical protein
MKQGVTLLFGFRWLVAETSGGPLQKQEGIKPLFLQNTRTLLTRLANIRFSRDNLINGVI